jgi:hypothetical protein
MPPPSRQSISREHCRRIWRYGVSRHRFGITAERTVVTATADASVAECQRDSALPLVEQHTQSEFGAPWSVLALAGSPVIINFAATGSRTDGLVPDEVTNAVRPFWPLAL